MKANTGVTQHTNGGDGTSPAVGHPPDLANVEPEARACHLKIRADAVGIHASALLCRGQGGAYCGEEKEKYYESGND